LNKIRKTVEVSLDSEKKLDARTLDNIVNTLSVAIEKALVDFKGPRSISVRPSHEIDSVMLRSTTVMDDRLRQEKQKQNNLK
jgi:hypothetical protein